MFLTNLIRFKQMTPLEIIIRRVPIYMAISGTLAYIVCYIINLVKVLKKNCKLCVIRYYNYNEQRTCLPGIKNHRQNMNTNNQQITTTYIVNDIMYDLYNDIIIVVGSGR